MAFANKKNRALNRFLRDKRKNHVHKSAAVAPSGVSGVTCASAFDIPQNYGDTYVRTIPKDPSLTFVYWELPDVKAAECGIPIRGNVHTQNDRAAWIKDRVSAHIDTPAPQHYTPAHIPQTQEPTFAREQTSAQEQRFPQDTAQPPSVREIAPAPLNVPITQKIEPKVIGPTIPSPFENYQHHGFADAQNVSSNNINGINTLSSETVAVGAPIQHNMSLQLPQSALLELTSGTSQQSAHENLRLSERYEFTFDFIIRDSAQHRDAVYDAALSSTMLFAANRSEA